MTFYILFSINSLTRVFFSLKFCCIFFFLKLFFYEITRLNLHHNPSWVFSIKKKKQHCFACFIFVYMRTHTHAQARKRASKQAIFAFVVSLRLFFSLPTITPLSFFLAYTRLYTAHRKGPCCAACTLACERVFSILFAAAAITIRHHIHSRRRRTHTYKAKQSSLHTYTAAITCALYV